MNAVFKIMLRNEGGKHFLQKISKQLKRRVWKARKRQRKQQMPYEIHKNVGVLHAVVFADGALEAKRCTVVEPQAVFEGGMERRKSEPNEQQSDKSEQK